MILGDRLSRSDRIIRWMAIGISAIPILASWIYTQGDRVNFIDCPIRHWLGIICPSCGMTRSFLAIARGNFQAALDYHLFGPLLFIWFGLVLLHSIWELRFDRYIQIFYIEWLNRLSLQISIFTSFIVYYLLRLNNFIPTHI